jgi:hypothetical protein
LNEAEFLLHTVPTNAVSFSDPNVEVNDSMLTLDLPAWPGRKVLVKTSSDLGMSDPWNRWLVTGNDGIPRAAGAGLRFDAPANDPHRFFRIMLEEE